MSTNIDLRELAEMTAQERVFLSVYMAGPQSLTGIEKRFERVRCVLKGGGAVNEDIMELFEEQERQSELDLWEKIRAEYMRGGLGVAGLDDVLEAARCGRVESMIVNRSFAPEGRRCRDCETLAIGAAESCSACGSVSLFQVDIVNEIVEMLKLTGADADFADPIDTLAEAGNIAALLRYEF